MLPACAGCGGRGGILTHTPGTPAGPYTITITATDSQASLTQTAVVNLALSQ